MKKFLLLSTVGMATLLLGNMFFSHKQVASADDLNRQAYEIRMKAMRASCSTIGHRLAKCYDGDTAACKSVTASQAWFLNEYNRLSSSACASEDAPFGEGAPSTR